MPRAANSASPLRPTFQGYVASSLDAILLFEAVLCGIICHTPRRPHDRERPELIRSGSIFLYEEHASGVKRWTDGVNWSPSRILDAFLVYRELSGDVPASEKKITLKKRKSMHDEDGEETYVETEPIGASQPGDSHPDRPLVGSLTNSYTFKEGGLIKKTVTLKHGGVKHHLVNYYTIEEAKHTLIRPVYHPELRGLLPRRDLLFHPHFVHHLAEEVLYEQNQGMCLIRPLNMWAREVRYVDGRVVKTRLERGGPPTNFVDPTDVPMIAFGHGEPAQQHMHQEMGQQMPAGQHMDHGLLPHVTHPNEGAPAFVGHMDPFTEAEPMDHQQAPHMQHDTSSDSYASATQAQPGYVETQETHHHGPVTGTNGGDDVGEPGVKRRRPEVPGSQAAQMTSDQATSWGAYDQTTAEPFPQDFTGGDYHHDHDPSQGSYHNDPSQGSVFQHQMPFHGDFLGQEMSAGPLDTAIVDHTQDNYLLHPGTLFPDNYQNFMSQPRPEFSTDLEPHYGPEDPNIKMEDHSEMLNGHLTHGIHDEEDEQDHGESGFWTTSFSSHVDPSLSNSQQ